MSGIVAGVQSGGCCCQPQGCTCSDPNRPGAIVDASLTAVSIEAEYNLRERKRGNMMQFCGVCPCGRGIQVGSMPQVTYFYQSCGCAVDPDFTEGTECESLVCQPGGCPCCPEYSVSVNFGNQVLERYANGWATVFRNPFDHLVGSWNWRPRQVGYCVPPGTVNVRVRTHDNFPFTVGPFSDGSSGIDPNGQYIDEHGNYTGGNIGPYHVYASASVTRPAHDICYYEARIMLFYQFQQFMLEQIVDAGGTLTLPGSIFAVYRKDCLTPFDTALGSYRCVYCEPTYHYAEQQECGPFGGVDELDITLPDRITVS